MANCPSCLPAVLLSPQPFVFLFQRKFSSRSKGKAYKMASHVTLNKAFPPSSCRTVREHDPPAVGGMLCGRAADTGLGARCSLCRGGGERGPRLVRICPGLCPGRPLRPRQPRTAGHAVCITGRAWSPVWVSGSRRPRNTHWNAQVVPSVVREPWLRAVRGLSRSLWRRGADPAWPGAHSPVPRRVRQDTTERVPGANPVTTRKMKRR